MVELQRERSVPTACPVGLFLLVLFKTNIYSRVICYNGRLKSNLRPQIRFPRSAVRLWGPLCGHCPGAQTSPSSWIYSDTLYTSKHFYQFTTLSTIHITHKNMAKFIQINSSSSQYVTCYDKGNEMCFLKKICKLRWLHINKLCYQQVFFSCLLLFLNGWGPSFMNRGFWLSKNRENKYHGTTIK